MGEVQLYRATMSLIRRTTGYEPLGRSYGALAIGSLNFRLESNNEEDERRGGVGHLVGVGEPRARAPPEHVRAQTRRRRQRICSQPSRGE